MQCSSTDRGDDEYSNARANAIRRLARLRTKRKLAENQHSNSIMVSARRPRTYKIPVPPTPPPREVNASRMQLLFEKRLKHSDVKEEGRIVIPKADAKKYMPALESKEGIYIFMDDMVGVRNWMFRYRYWPNNSSRVYVLENAGELIKAYGLQVGDFIMVYKEDRESRSFAIGTRKSDAKDDDELSVPVNAADPIPMAASIDENLVPDSDESRVSTTTSCPPKSAGSEYGGGLKGFPFQLLKVDVFDLPEY